jgi:metallophosphoesterase superfamily enzyme
VDHSNTRNHWKWDGDNCDGKFAGHISQRVAAKVASQVQARMGEMHPTLTFLNALDRSWRLEIIETCGGPLIVLPSFEDFAYSTDASP